MLSVTLRQLEYAVAVARNGGVSAAAEALSISQPALSVALGQLETHLGKALFLRRAGGRVVPTSFGKGFLDEAERILTALENLTQGDEPRATPVTLSCFDDLAPLVLAPILAALAVALPDVTIVPRVGSFEELAEDLSSGVSDLAITYDLGLDNGIHRHQLALIEPHALLSAEHPLAQRKRLSLEELAGPDLVLTDQGLSINHIHGLFRQRGLTPNIAHRVATLEIMRSYVANGLGIGISYTRPLPPRSFDGKRVIGKDIVADGLAEPVVLARNLSNPLSTAAEAVAETIRSLRGLLPGEPETENTERQTA